MSDPEDSREKVRGATAGGELARGRAHYQHRAWAAAYESLARADQLGPLAASDLELLATAAYLVGRDAEYLKALERAHRAHLDSGAVLPAARCAFWLGLRLAFRGDTGQASGWFGRAQRLLEREARQSVEQGYLLLPVVEQRLDAGDSDAAYAVAQNAAEVGERFGEGELIAIARHQQGRARLQQQRLEEGLALLDEVMVMVVAGRLSPVVTGLMYCSVVDSCQRVYAFDRAREWTAALAAWCDEQPEMVAFAGICRVHRAEVLQLSGDWTDALAEARRACERVPAADRQAGAAASYQLGEILRLTGDLVAAEHAYRSASEKGLDPQPGLSLLRLAQGRTETAAAAVRRATKVSAPSWQRTRLLPACVEIFLAAGATQDAREACAELEALARDCDTCALRATAAQARGMLELAEGSPEIALRSLRAALELWQRVEAPYLVASVRAAIGLAFRALGDDEGSKLELDAARLVFERLGALADVRRVAAYSRPAERQEALGLTGRELEVLRLVASGMTNKSIATTLFVSERTVDRHVSNIFVKLGVTSRAAATARAYEHQLI